MADCIFCRIAAGEIPATLVHQDEQAIVFRDLNPQAPVHLLLVPRQHLGSLANAAPQDAGVLGHLIGLVPVVAREAGLERGYRVVINTGADGGQTVGHLHLHLLGGRAMHWPPG